MSEDPALTAGLAASSPLGADGAAASTDNDRRAAFPAMPAGV